MAKDLTYAKYKYARISHKKVAPVMDLVRGKAADEAVRVLKFNSTKAAVMVLKALNSAIANAKVKSNVSASDLYVSNLQVSPAPTFKRGRIVARSRFSPILKRTSHIVVGLAERAKK